MKNKIIYIASVFLCVALLVGGYLFVVRNGSPFGVKYEDSGSYVRAKITEVAEPDIDNNGYGSTITTYEFRADVKSGAYKGETVTALQTIDSASPVKTRPVAKGDSVVLYVMDFDEPVTYHFAEYVRSDALIVLAVLFSVFLIVFGRSKGFKTLVTLALTLCAVFFILIPAVLNGYNIYVYTIAVCLYITAMTFVIVNGISYLSLVSFMGCMGGVFVSAILTLVTDYFIKLTGFCDESDIYLVYLNDHEMDLKALVFAGILIGCIGAVMDVAINMSAALHEVACKIEKPTYRELFKSGITIGRDMIGTMSNTLILAYIGSSFSTVLLIFYNNSFAPVAMFNKEGLVTEILTMLIGSFGILSALPLTSAIAALFYSKWDRSVVCGDMGASDKEQNDIEEDEYVTLLKSVDED